MGEIQLLRHGECEHNCDYRNKCICFWLCCWCYHYYYSSSHSLPIYLLTKVGKWCIALNRRPLGVLVNENMVELIVTGELRSSKPNGFYDADKYECKEAMSLLLNYLLTLFKVHIVSFLLLSSSIIGESSILLLLLLLSPLFLSLTLRLWYLLVTLASLQASRSMLTLSKSSWLFKFYFVLLLTLFILLWYSSYSFRSLRLAATRINSLLRYDGLYGAVALNIYGECSRINFRLELILFTLTSMLSLSLVLLM